MTGETGRSGLREAHVHIAQLGRSLSMLDAAGVRSGGELIEAVAGHARGGGGGVVLGHGVRPEAWDDARWPSGEALAEAARTDEDRDPVVVIWCFDHHALVASPAALRLAGVDEGTPDPRGGRFERDGDGRLTGLCIERAALRVWDALPEPSEEERLRFVRDACGHLASLGFAEAHDMRAQAWLPETLVRLDEEGSLPIGVRMYALVEEVEAMAARRGGFERDRVRLVGGKLFADGTLNSRTAWMLHPYADVQGEHACGTAMLTGEEMDAAIATCEGLGLPIATHAIGDAAVRFVLDAIERNRPMAGRYRVEHAEFVDEADVSRFAELGVVCSPQPCHLLVDIEALRRGTPDRLDRVLPLKELLASGLVAGETLVFGSDAPIVRANAEDSVRAAVDRTRAAADGERSPEPIAPEQAIDEATAWACFGAARAGD